VVLHLIRLQVFYGVPTAGGSGFGGQPADGIYTIDTNTGAATLVGKTGLGGSTPDIHFDQ